MKTYENLARVLPQLVVQVVLLIRLEEDVELQSGVLAQVLHQAAPGLRLQVADGHGGLPQAVVGDHVGVHHLQVQYGVLLLHGEGEEVPGLTDIEWPW